MSLALHLLQTQRIKMREEALRMELYKSKKKEEHPA
jgi:hypothetical protein